MWKCKKCGGTGIVKYVSGKFNGKSTNFNKNEESLSTEDLDLDTLYSSEYVCENCGRFEIEMKDIAEWVEGDKND